MPANTQLPHRLRTTWQLPWYFPQPRTNLKFPEISNKYHNFPTTKKNKANKNTTLQGFIFVITEGLGPPKQIQALLPALRTFRCSHGGLEHWCTGWKAYVVKTGLWCGGMVCGMWLWWSKGSCSETAATLYHLNICRDIKPYDQQSTSAKPFLWQFVWRMCYPQICPSKFALKTAPRCMSPFIIQTCMDDVAGEGWKQGQTNQPFVPCVWTSWRACSHWAKPCDVEKFQQLYQMNSSKLNTFLIAQIDRSKPVYKPLTTLPL